MADELKVPNRGLITLCVMAGNLMQSLDSSIATVSLPYMQGSLSASADEITWVLTSYVIAAAIMTAPVGWLATRFGRKNLHVACMLGFVIASMMCGAADTLAEMVTFRLLQGMCGAALVPLSLATMLDIYPAERRPYAMAIFGMGVMVGPIAGPVIGGYLTAAYSWRYVFYVNLPLGILAASGLMIFLPRATPRSDLRFDWIGFAVLATGIGAMQLMLDRGQDLDWFSSREIIIAAVLAGLGFYLFIVHMLTAKQPFMPQALFKDRNYIAGMAIVLTTGTVMLASTALMAPYLETLAQYPVESAGLSMAPRGLGVVIGMQISSRLANRIDHRVLMAAGLLTMGIAFYTISFWTPNVPDHTMMLVLGMQGLGTGMLFNALTVASYATLPASLRAYGASFQSLCRYMGQAVGVSLTSTMLVRKSDTAHASLTADITPFDRVLEGHDTISRLLNPASRRGAELLNGMINHQAQIIAFNDDFRMMCFVVIPPLVLLLLMRRVGAPPATRAVAATRVKQAAGD